MHPYDDIGDASSSLWGSTSSFNYFHGITFKRCGITLLPPPPLPLHYYSDYSRASNNGVCRKRLIRGRLPPPRQHLRPPRRVCLHVCRQTDTVCSCKNKSTWFSHCIWLCFAAPPPFFPEFFKMSEKFSLGATLYACHRRSKFKSQLQQQQFSYYILEQRRTCFIFLVTWLLLWIMFENLCLFSAETVTYLTFKHLSEHFSSDVEYFNSYFLVYSFRYDLFLVHFIHNYSEAVYIVRIFSFS